MATYAQVIDGLAVNVVPCDPKICFAEDWLKSRPPFQIVPDGTMNFAKKNQDGSFINPTPTPEPEVTDVDEALKLLVSKGLISDKLASAIAGGKLS